MVCLYVPWIGYCWKKIDRIRGVATIPNAMASIKPSPLVPPKLSEAIAGPGHSPAIPQPAPKNIDPMTSWRLNSGAAPEFCATAGCGLRALTIRHATAIGTIAPPITKAKVGSHAPKISSQPWTLSVFVMPDTHSPMPNRAPLRSANKIRIRSTPTNDVAAQLSPRRLRYKYKLKQSPAARAARYRKPHGQRCSHWQVGFQCPPADRPK